MSNKKDNQDDIWEPPMGKSQRLLFWDNAKYILAHSERFSGKTDTALNKAVKHCYLYNGALACIITLVRTGQKAGGAWDLLNTQDTRFETGKPIGILRRWEDGLGLEYGEEYQDDSKNVFVDIRNQFGGISKIMYKSMLIGSHIKDRIRDIIPSYWLFEELTSTYDEDYFLKPIQQLGRHPAVPYYAQQYVATCNPPDQGPDHWVYKKFFEEPKDHEGGWDPDFSIHHIPFSENTFISEERKKAYQKNIMVEAKSDPTAYDRLILGKWLPKITGKSIFNLSFDRNIHVKGVPGVSGLGPIPGFPIVIGYDPGEVNNARVFMQRIKFANGKKKWRIFDNLVSIKQRKTIKVLIIELMVRMAYWLNRIPKGRTEPYPFKFVHISDRQAIDFFNAQGSPIYLQYEKISKDLIAQEGQFKGLTPITMIAPPKRQDSVAERVILIQELLAADEIIVSANASKVVNMFERLRKAKDRNTHIELDYRPLRTSTGEIHVFDAISYPIYAMESFGYSASDHSNIAPATYVGSMG